MHYRDSFETYNFEYTGDPYQSIKSLKEFIQDNGPKISYIFDDISCLKKKKGKTAFFDFFRAINLQLQELKAVSYWPLLKGSIVQDTVAKLSGLVQLLVSIERTDEGACIHPLKVPSERFYQMLKPYSFDFESLGLEKRVEALMILELLMQKITEVDQLKQDLKRSEERYQDLLETTTQYKNIVGRSEHIRKVCRMISVAAASNATVLIQGESGTGKELVSAAIHFHSLCSKGPFIKVNCAALSETLLESELFGHKKGSFTGAIRDRKGKFKLADGGTILLDEIGCMSINGQAKLLRVLQEKEIEPVGGSTPIKVNVRVIATTNLTLKKAMDEGRFREDLYYRLNVFPIQLLPLRDRMEDVLLLAKHFLKKYSEEMKKTIREIPPVSSSILQAYNWPGNVRELENAIEYAVMLENGETMQAWNLPKRILDALGGKTQLESLNLRRKLETIEKKTILKALNRTNWVKKQAAKILGIDPKNLSYFLKKHHISKRDRKP
ncbi:sigma-54-dependent Fis family transcriptional regulator [candidate division WOR-3 bacterium]|nr:sigma-54-dependent Fis family transcriptional regulator [candidate division WOR-3 bacterium]